MAIEAAYASDVGRRRHNEDACLLDLDIGLMLVADGVGGHQAGEVASAITCEAVAQALRAGGDLVDGIRSANRAVMEAVDDGRGREGMATTAVALSFTDHNFELAWVGDSRAYLWNGTQLQLLSRDHSLVENLLSRGEISLEEARTHPQKNVIVQAIGLQADYQLRIDVNSGALGSGETLLLCSDGVSDVLENAKLVQLLEQEPDLQACCELLVRTAIELGGSDNATAILVRLEPGGDPISGVPPQVVWSFDPRSGEVSGLHQIAPEAQAEQGDEDQANDDPHSTQMMSLDSLQRQLNKARAERHSPVLGSRRMLTSAVLAAVLVLSVVVLVALFVL